MDNIKKVENLKYIKIQTNDQIDSLVNLAKEIWTEHFGPMFNDVKILNSIIEANQSRKIISDQINNRYLYFYIQKGSQIIGYFAYKLNKNELFISKLYLISSERRKGLGKQILEYLESIAFDNKKNKLSLTVYYKNSIAIKAYEKNGFKNIETIKRDFGDNVICTDYKMEKSVY